MNDVLASVWSESIGRLALGLEPRDALTLGRVRDGLTTQIEVHGTPLRAWRRFRAGETLSDLLPHLPRHSTNRFAALTTLVPGDEIVVRLHDPFRWYVPRRLRIELADPDDVLAAENDPNQPTIPAADRAIHPTLHPGAAHPVTVRATGVIGRVLQAGEPLRWARIRVDDRRTGRALAHAHGDDRGQFVAVIRGTAGAMPATPIETRIRVFGPDVAPDPGPDPERASLDRLWDLPVETVAVPARGLTAGVLAGTATPADYVESDDGPVDIDLPLGVIRSRDIDDFAFTPP